MKFDFKKFLALKGERWSYIKWYFKQLKKSKRYVEAR